MNYGKSTFVARYMSAWAKANPGQRGVILCGAPEGASRARKSLTRENGGARPFNVKVTRV